MIDKVLIANQIANCLPYFLAFMENPPLQIMQQITPQDLESALAAKGWVEIGRTDGVISVWMRDEKQGVVVPLDPNFVGYSLEVVKVLRIVFREDVDALIEGISNGQDS